jgi:hypothetical protein
MRRVTVGAAIALAVGMAAGLMSTAAAQGDRQYVGHTQCKVCHNAPDQGAQWDSWKTEKHSKALETLKTDAAQAIAKERGLTVPAHEAPDCLKCHVTGYDVATKKAPAKIKIEDGVQCESCHGPNSAHVKDGQLLKFNPEKASEIDIMANLKPVTQEDCLKCHNPESPTWDPERFTLPDGSKAGFHFETAKAQIDHSNPQKKD